MAGMKACRGSRRGGREEGGGEAAAVDANRWVWDGDATNGEMIQLTVKEKEKERARATRDVNTVAALAVTVTEGRRKRRQCRSVSSLSEDDTEEEGK